MRDSNLLEPDQTERDTDPPEGHIKALLRNGQSTLISRFLRVVLVLGIFALAAGFYDFSTTGESLRLFVIGIVCLTLLFVTFVPGITYGIKAGVLLLLIYGIGVINVSSAGPAGNGLLFLLTVPVLATLFFDQRAGILSIIWVVITVMILAILFITGVIHVLPETYRGLDEVASWIPTGAIFIFLVVLMTVPQYAILQPLFAALVQENQLTSAFNHERASWEKRIAERTEVLSRRARYLEASAIVAREASGIIDDPDALLQRVVQVISERFGFYHSGLFLNDAGGEWADIESSLQRRWATDVSQGAPPVNRCPGNRWIRCPAWATTDRSQCR